jgi:replicative DNA helicase
MANHRTSAAKAPPYSVASEKIVIGSILREPKMAPHIAAILPDGGAFFRPEHGRFFGAVLAACAQHPADGEQLVKALSDDDSPHRASSVEQVHSFRESGQGQSIALQHAQIVAEKARMRRLIDALTDILHEAYHCEAGVDGVIRRALAKLKELERPDISTEVKPSVRKATSARRTR